MFWDFEKKTHTNFGGHNKKKDLNDLMLIQNMSKIRDDSAETYFDLSENINLPSVGKRQQKALTVMCLLTN